MNRVGSIKAILSILSSIVYLCNEVLFLVSVLVSSNNEKNLRDGEILYHHGPRMAPNTTAVLAIGPLSPLLRHQQPDYFTDIKTKETNNLDLERKA